MTLIAFRDPVSAWTHCAWLVLSLPATWLLWRRCQGDRSRQISMLVYGIGLSACFAGSTLFHGVRLSSDELELFNRIDHVGIYLLIAGSYTPLAWSMMEDRSRFRVLSSVWLTALLGSGFLIFEGLLPDVWGTVIYMAMGWGAIFCYIELLRVVSHRTLFPLLLGGFLYSVGALINLAHWPVILPGIFGYHEIFHLFVMAGSLSHFLFTYHVVAPHRMPSPMVKEPLPVEVQKKTSPLQGRRWAKIG